ncbi:hypothetical protein SLEP1_g33928 [Rubroshorea leprosula]|uniref:Uncharacterized protein n=1 Tax=Rubroshorea leprosula TaxID=152421 RepID=A0AAV5KIG3_9ROSI|nr:hypothetical protein SLEP1_g33928 [Rubroshorea leprosula]
MVHFGGPYGENLAWSSGDLIGVAAVQMWVNEKADYNYQFNSCAAGKVCGITLRWCGASRFVWDVLRLGVTMVEHSSAATTILEATSVGSDLID